MKLLLLLATVSCSTLNPEFSTYYYSDTTKRVGLDCEVKVERKSLVDTFFGTWTEEDKKDFEAHAGYSDCIDFKPSETTHLVECKKPTSYKRIVTTSLAECDKFMTVNKLK
jgi:hypothetical protein